MKQTITLFASLVFLTLHTSDQHLETQKINETLYNKNIEGLFIPEQFVKDVFQPHDINLNLNNNNNATIITSISNKIEITVTTIQTWISQKKDDSFELLHALINYVSNHKFFLGCCTLSAIYTYLFIYTLKTKYFLHNKTCWHNWKKELSFEQLCTLPAADISYTLLHHVQSRYMNHQNPTDHVTPLAQFMNAIEAEMKKLTQYIFIGKWLTRLKLSIVLPINQSSILVSQQKLQRLHFIKHLFVESIASQNTAVVT